MSIEQLNITTPLVDRKEFIGDYVDVSEYKELRIAYFADTQLRLHLEFSIDKKVKGITSSYIIPSDLWRTETIKIVMPFLRVRVINESFGTSINNNIVVSFFSHSKVRFSKNEALGKVEMPTEDERKSYEIPLPIANSQPERSKSPWWKKRRDSKPNNVNQSQLDYRLPQFIPEWSILTGTKNGRVMSFPKGVAGMVLACNERGQLQWMTIGEVLELQKRVDNGEI